MERGERIDWLFLKKWRERYRWPLRESRKASEERIIYIETLVKNNILEKGNLTVKDVLSKIVEWKTGGRYQALTYFLSNPREFVEDTVVRVLAVLERDPDDVSECINLFRRLRGVRIAIASTFLRFLDPIEHKYGIIDKNVASFLNKIGITNFSLRHDGYVIDLPENVREYRVYHDWLHQKVKELDEENATYIDIYGNKQRFTPVDVEMALFAYTTQIKRV